VGVAAAMVGVIEAVDVSVASSAPQAMMPRAIIGIRRYFSIDNDFI
jgi:hypothetical protein